MDSSDCWLLYLGQLSSCQLGSSQLALVHGICRCKSLPIIPYPMVFDGKDFDQTWSCKKLTKEIQKNFTIQTAALVKYLFVSVQENLS
jgi:hypothetical protein